MSIRSSPLFDGSLTLKTEDLDGTVELWQGNAVGMEAKELFEAVEQCYPNTFQQVQIRVKPFWLSNLKELHAVIKAFMEAPVDALVEDQINGFRQDFKDFERLGFDLSWAHKRLDMVARLKFGNEPLQKELIALEDSLGPLKEEADKRMEELDKAYNMWTKAKLEYDTVMEARNKKAEEMVQEFGPDFDRVLKDRLGFGMLPDY
ncbi:hypothetical protein L1887_19673 [Cichorium endivia]|nr:hypothetical protein L1887_19673 [Cichorium endivia]